MRGLGLALILTAGCAGDAKVDTLATADANVKITSTIGTSAWIYTGDDPLQMKPIDGHCLTLDASLAGTIAGQPMTVVKTGGYNATQQICDAPQLQLHGKIPVGSGSTIEVSDLSGSIVMTLAPDDILETRTATYLPNTGDGLAHVTWSHPADLVGATPRITFTPSGNEVPGWSVEGTVNGDEITYQVPANVPNVPGTRVILANTVSGTATTCVGAAQCTFDIWHEAH